MTNRTMDQIIKDMYREEAVKLKAPGSIKLNIDRRLTASPGKKESVKMFKNKKRLILVAAAVFLLGSTAVFAGTKAVSTIGWANAEPDSKVFADCKKFAKKQGFSIRPVETFSNDYTYSGINVLTNQDYDSEGKPAGEVYKLLKLEYRNDFQRISIMIDKASEDTDFLKNVLEEFEVDGRKVYLTEYIHMMVPLDHEFTEEEQELIDSGRAGTGTDSVTYEVNYTHYYFVKWEQDGLWYSITREAGQSTIEDWKLMASEWIEANK